MSIKELLCGCRLDGDGFKPCGDHAVDRICDDAFNKLADELDTVDRRHGLQYDYSKLRERKAPHIDAG